MIFGGFGDGKWKPMEGGCLGIEIRAGEWTENTMKLVGEGLVVWCREKEEREEAKP